MKKILITILIIIILAGAGYFVYTKGLINLDFLNKGEVVEDLAVVENQQAVQMIAPTNIIKDDISNDTLNKVVGGYYAYRNYPHQVILKNNKTFVIENEIEDPVSLRIVRLRGTFSIEGSKLKLTYNDGRKDEYHDLIPSPEDNSSSHVEYIDGEFDFIHDAEIDDYVFTCEDWIHDLLHYSNLDDKVNLYKEEEKYKGGVYSTVSFAKVLDKIENNIMYINITLGRGFDPKKMQWVEDNKIIMSLSLDMDKKILKLLPRTSAETETVLDFDKESINDIKIACKK